MEMKRRFPFRIGSTSFVLPADIRTNVEYLAGKVDDIELVLFESDEIAELPDKGTVEILRSIAVRENLTYTVHFPLDIWFGDPDRTERKKSVRKCARVIETMKPLNPMAYILHCNRTCRENNRQEPVALWKSNTEASFDELLGTGLSPEMVCVETLDYPFPLIAQLVRDRGMSICLDIGHILLNGYPLAEYLHLYLKQSRVIHLHGVANDKDHQDISLIDNRSLSTLFSLLGSDRVQQRVVTLEVFNKASLKKSLSCLEEFLP